MIKFMALYGLTSGTSAAMAIARRAMHHSERLPKWLQRPEDHRSPTGKQSRHEGNPPERAVSPLPVAWVECLESLYAEQLHPSSPAI